MLRILYVVVSFFVSFLVTNVWLFRFNKETPYRGGDAVNMIEEFAEYGLNTNIMYLVGFLKLLLVWLDNWTFKTKISVYSSLLMSFLMIGV